MALLYFLCRIVDGRIFIFNLYVYRISIVLLLSFYYTFQILLTVNYYTGKQRTIIFLCVILLPLMNTFIFPKEKAKLLENVET
jgi:hypothetical protein